MKMMYRNLMPKKFKGKKKKKPKGNYFERLTVEQLTSFCTAALLATTGTKPLLIARLFATETTERFGRESKATSVSRTGDVSYGKHGCALDAVNAELKTLGASCTGAKFVLIERLLQVRHNT
jgi:hypothetical protein|tara:strand:- start:3132 stop:3497 length:366 start_codon:yes stop_codon:yes gene_type:complete